MRIQKYYPNAFLSPSTPTKSNEQYFEAGEELNESNEFISLTTV